MVTFWKTPNSEARTRTFRRAFSQTVNVAFGVFDPNPVLINEYPIRVVAQGNHVNTIAIRNLYVRQTHRGSGESQDKYIFIVPYFRTPGRCSATPSNMRQNRLRVGPVVPTLQATQVSG
eukprot:scaffold1391_cov123-Cylindrotheca_fusiformis.AAC.18